MALSDAQIAAVVKDAGFPPASQTIAVAVALAESGGNPTAQHTNSNGSKDYGLFQINSIHAELLNGHLWSDPLQNAIMALSISSNGANWQPWVTYNNGAFRTFLPRAARATGNPAINYPTANSSPGPSGISRSPGSLSNPDFWRRLAFFIAGALLLWGALLRSTNIDNQIRGAVYQGAKLAVTKGLVK